MSGKMHTNRIWNIQYTALFLVNVILNISFYMTATALSKHLVDLSFPVAAAGSIIGIMPMASMLIRPVSGWICDRFRKKRLLGLFLLINALCVAGYGFAQHSLVFYLLRIFHGVSFGMTTTITMAMIAGYIPEGRMGEGLGYFGLAQTLAVAIGPSVGLFLSGIAGNHIMFLFASLCVIVSVILSTLLKDDAVQDSQRISNPSGSKSQFKLQSFIAKEAVLYGVITVALSSTNGIENSYIALYGEQFGMGNVGWYFTLSAVTLLFSRTLCGKLMDKKGFSVVLYPGIASVILAFLLLSWASTTNAAALFAAAAILKAIGVGAVQPSLQAATIQAVEPERRGAATSTFYIGTDLGQASAPAIAGKLVDVRGYPFMYRTYTIPLFCVCLLYAAVVFRRRNKASQKIHPQLSDQ